MNFADRYSTVIAFLAAVGLIFALDWSFLQKGFHEDDYVLLAHVGKLGSSTIELFSPYRQWFYRPVFLVYFSGVRTIFGPSSTAFHSFSLVLDAANVAALFCLVRRIAGRFPEAVVAAALALWALRNSEAVWWISSTSTLLAGLFYQLTLIGWISYHETGNRRWRVAALLGMAGALLSKEDAVSLPFAMAAMDVLVLRSKLPTTKRILAEYGLIAAITLVYVILDLIAVRLVVWPQKDSVVSDSFIKHVLTANTFACSVGANVLPTTGGPITMLGWPVWILFALALWTGRKSPVV